MMTMIIAWLVIIALIALSVFSDKVPFWPPIIVWLILASFRLYEVIGNYRDDEKNRERGKNLQLGKSAAEMAARGLEFSSVRTEEENLINEDSEYQSRRARRRLWVDVANCVLLK